MVKHKSKYSCKSMIYFNLGSDIIKENCKFAFNFNNTDISPTVPDRGNEIILANWPDDKPIICNPSYPYILVNRNILCNYRIESGK